MSRQSATWESFYEKAWGLRKSLAEKFVDLGVKDPYQLVQKMEIFEGKYSLDREDDTGKVRFLKKEFPGENHLFPTGKPYFKYTHLGEQLFAQPFYSSVPDFLLDFLDGRDFDAIVELGSGYGANLIELYYRGGPQKTPYYAGEYTKSGVELTQYLVSLKKELPITPFHFDFKKPDLSAVKERGNILIFTSHSIEQVSEISEELFTYLSSYAKSVTCIHFEPFGFQMGPTEDHGEASKLQAVVFKEKDWNSNFAPTLLNAHQKGILSISCVAKNVMGKEVGNPTSIAIWESKKTGSA